MSYFPNYLALKLPIYRQVHEQAHYIGLRMVREPFLDD